MDDECTEELGRPISSLKVAELRDELTRRMLTKTGNKKELTDRLRHAIQKKSSQANAASSGSESGVTKVLDQGDHSLSFQQQQQFLQQQQNIPSQYMNAAAAAAAAAAMQQHQNQVAPYQIQTQNTTTAQQLSGFNLPLAQQPFQQTMQPLDLQQQLTDYQNQIQLASAEYQQQHLQPAEQRLQDQSPAVTNIQPPIDMRVPQSQNMEPGQLATFSPEQSIDLSNSLAKQQKLSQQSEHKPGSDVQNEEVNSATPVIVQATSVIHEQQSNEDDSLEQLSTKTDNEKLQTQFEEMIDEEKNRSDPTAPQKQESHTSSRGDDSSSSKVEDDLGHESKDREEKLPVRELNTQEAISEKRSSDEPSSSEKDKSDTLQAQPAETQYQSPFSLKRGNHEQRASSGSKEKRRKWSSKQADVNQSGDSSQASLISGGISSQKLQELIETKVVDGQTSKESQRALDTNDQTIETNQDIADVQNQGPEEGEINTSGESTNLELPPKDKLAHEKEQTAVVENSQTEKEAKIATVPEPQVEPTNILLVQNLVRPFTIMQLKEVLTKHGSMSEEKFWTDKVKSKCCVMYNDVETAQLTRESLNGQQWPTSNPKTLKISYINEETLSKYQKSDLAKTSGATNSSSNPPEAGVTNNQDANKSIANRLGDKPTDSDRSVGGQAVKKRLGERVLDAGTKSSSLNRAGDNSKPQELDDLFKKTKAVPHLFWLPLTEGQADTKQKERGEREKRNKELAQKSRRSPPPRRRSPPKHRSPAHRRPSTNRHPSPSRRRSRSMTRSRSPIMARSPPPPRYRSPISRRSPPMRHRSPVSRNSPIRRRSPAQNRWSPTLGHHRPSPGLVRRSPGLVRRSPRAMRQGSPNRLLRRSPAMIRRSPGPIRRSPGLLRRSPGLIRRSPGMIRRSPAPIRGSSPSERSPPRKRSPARRRSPVRNISPNRQLGYLSEHHRRPQRLDRLR